MRWTTMAVAAAGMMLSAASGAQQARPVTAGSDGDKMVCKSNIETGSLVRAKKRCFAKKDWARITDTEQRGARKLVEQLTEAQTGN